MCLSTFYTAQCRNIPPYLGSRFTIYYDRHLVKSDISGSLLLNSCAGIFKIDRAQWLCWNRQLLLRHQFHLTENTLGFSYEDRLCRDTINIRRYLPDASLTFVRFKLKLMLSTKFSHYLVYEISSKCGGRSGTFEHTRLTYPLNAFRNCFVHAP
jgi:hypothetical protein